MKGLSLEVIWAVIIAIASVTVFLALVAGNIFNSGNWLYCNFYLKIINFFSGRSLANIPDTCKYQIQSGGQLVEINDSDNTIVSRKLLALMISCWQEAEEKSLYSSHPCYEVRFDSVVDCVTEYNVSQILIKEDYCKSIEDANYGCGKLNQIRWMQVGGVVYNQNTILVRYVNDTSGQYVELFGAERTGTSSHSFSSVVECDSKPVVANLGNLIVIGDATFYYSCCSSQTMPFENLAQNSAKYLGGTKILIVWEYYITPAFSDDPNNVTRARLLNSLAGNGFSVDTLRHTSPLTYAKLSAYSQVWFVRPGACENPAISPYCGYQWKDSEFDAINQYLNSGGKAVILTDYAYNVPQRVENRIVSLVNPNAAFIPTCFCGCDGSTVPSSWINQTSPLANNIVSYPVSAATGLRLQMSCK